MSENNEHTPDAAGKDSVNSGQEQEARQDQTRDAGFSASLEAFETREEAPVRPARSPRRSVRNVPAKDSQADAVPEIPMGPAPEAFEEDDAAEAARLADQDFDEFVEDTTEPQKPSSRVPVVDVPETVEAADGTQAGQEPDVEAPGEEQGRRRRGRRRRGRGRRGKGGAGQASPSEAGAEGQLAEAQPEGITELASSSMDVGPEATEESAYAAAAAEPAATREPGELVGADDGGAASVEAPAEPAAPGEQPAEGDRGRRRRRRGRGRRGRGRGRGEEPAEAAAAGQDAAASEQEATLAAETGPEREEEAEAVEEEDLDGAGHKVMLVNIAQTDECRIAMLEDDKLQEFYVERTAALSHVGNIYKGVVTNIEPSIQAAFIDFGEGKNGFLHISDLQPQYFPGGGEAEDVGRKTPRKERPPIQKCLRRNQEIVVQVTKEGIGTKGATLTTYVALPGRYLVMMPGMSRLGVSRKIEDEDARRRMRDVLNQLELPGDMGFILRTAGLDRTKRDLQRDLNYLVRLWKQIQKRKNSVKSPAELYQESDLVTRTLRDVVTTDVKEILIDSERVTSAAKQFLRLLSPRLAERVRFYSDSQPLFFKYGVEDEIAKIYSKRVPLASGGYLVIESTEALVAIDVNSGKYRETPDPEESAFRINVEAAEEIARQLSLRDLGGVIICDFIDMHMERHRREIERALREALKAHKERAEILRMSRFGIIEMTRQRQRPSIIRSMLIDCPHCTGTGMIKSTETVMLETLRAIQTAATHPDVSRIEVRVDPEVAQMLLNTKRRALTELETTNRKSITVLPTTDVAANKITLTCFDHRGWPVQVALPKAMMSAAGAGGR